LRIKIIVIFILLILLSVPNSMAESGASRIEEQITAFMNQELENVSNPRSVADCASAYRAEPIQCMNTGGRT
jgi:hypothetical protein